MMDRHELAIARTVIYASLFDYPLTLDQLHASLISLSISKDQIAGTYQSSRRLHAAIEHRDGYFFPAGRGDLIEERQRREARSRAFLQHHAAVLRLVATLPFTRLVALSGSIAHLNLEEGGDLDLFIVTRGRHVWTVTVAMIVLARLLGVRRVMCANFVMSDAQLTIAQQDLFTANQVLHLKPLIGSEVLEGFVAANPFVRRFYPNRMPPPPPDPALQPTRAQRALKSALETILAIPAPAVEAFCRHAYAWYLRRKSAAWRSPDQVLLDRDSLKLHTQSHRQSVLERFDERVEEAAGRSDRAAIA